MKLSKEVMDLTLKNLLRVADVLVFNTAMLLLSLSQTKFTDLSYVLSLSARQELDA